MGNALEHPTRGVWLIGGCACLATSALTAWALILGEAAREPAGLVAVAALSGLYAWAGIAAVTVGRARPTLTIEAGEMVIEHAGLLDGPLRIQRSMVGSVTLDERAMEDRRVAAAVRGKRLARPSFLDARAPVLSASPSSHAPDGSAAPPNMVVGLTRPLTFGRVPLMPRFLLRVAQGRRGIYAGPRSGASTHTIRILVEDPRAVAAALESWDVLAVAPRDAVYLAPVSDANRSTARAERRTLVIGVTVLTAVFLALALAQMIVRG